jgi:hypothetical protein
MIILIITFISVILPVIQKFRKRGKSRNKKSKVSFHKDYLLNPDFSFTLIFGLVFTYALITSGEWEMDAKLIPMLLGVFGIIISFFHISSCLFKSDHEHKEKILSVPGQQTGEETTHFDIQADYGDLTSKVIYSRAGRYLLWCIGYIIIAQLIGLLPAILVFVIAYMRLEAKESWRVTLTISSIMWGLCYLLFHSVLKVLWPLATIGSWFPVLRSIREFNLF